MPSRGAGSNPLLHCDSNIEGRNIPLPGPRWKGLQKAGGGTPGACFSRRQPANRAGGFLAFTQWSLLGTIPPAIENR
jgi:hypothetical protein